MGVVAHTCNNLLHGDWVVTQNVPPPRQDSALRVSVIPRILCRASILVLRPFGLIISPMTFAPQGMFTAQSWQSELITVSYKMALKWLALSW